MKKVLWIIAVGLVISLTVSTTTSCSKELFDKETADTMKLLSFHNDKVDANQDWLLIRDWTLQVKANVPGVKRIEILSENPYQSPYAEILATHNVTENQQIGISYSMPTLCEKVYVAAVTDDGTYTIVETTADNSSVVDFSSGRIDTNGTMYELRQQQVFYCFDTAFPEPSSTWGYNDLVLSVAKEYVNEYVMRLKVTLRAIGTTKQVAAAIRLDGVPYENVSHVAIEGNNTFVHNKDAKRVLIENQELLIKAKDGSAVINLFDDAHAAFYTQQNDNGTVSRYKFNVSHEVGPEYMGYPELTVTYYINFNEPGFSDRIGFLNFDPFVVYYYITTPWEIHKFRYKFQETIWDYFGDNQSAYKDRFTWCVEVPYSQFRYPTAGNSLGSYKSGAIYGTYQKRGHSFGEWVSNEEKARDWYLYPTESMVY